MQRHAMLSCRQVVGSARAALGLGGEIPRVSAARPSSGALLGWCVCSSRLRCPPGLPRLSFLPPSTSQSALSVPPAPAQLSGWTRAVLPFPETLVPRVSTDLSRVLGRGRADTSCGDSAPNRLPPYHPSSPNTLLPPAPQPSAGALIRFFSPLPSVLLYKSVGGSGKRLIFRNWHFPLPICGPSFPGLQESQHSPKPLCVCQRKTKG